jgi:hypothetical protein
MSTYCATRSLGNPAAFGGKSYSIGLLKWFKVARSVCATKQLSESSMLCHEIRSTCCDGWIMNSDGVAQPKWQALEKWEGPAFASIIAVLCGLAFQKLEGIFDGALYWFIFTVFCGLYIDPRRYESWRELLLYCTIPAAWLIATWSILPALGIVWGGFRPTDGDREFYTKLLVVGPVTFAFTVLAIPLWAIGRGPILQIISTDPTRVGKLVKTLQGVGLIISMILTAVLYMKGIGSSK